ncbi:type III secretion system chaperone [Sodalis sp. dw_96]|uniref:type III secretion system chaperone n=1 Tax=Sodalis sp. dw_96 TaxID=2719794 RepID=UPI001BD42B73|nr:type III secretion system chaperone [Sodalis sp. dw_96]
MNKGSIVTFEELLNSLALDTHLDIRDATKSGGCTIRFDQHINITLERHDKWVYLFSPVMSILNSLPEDFFSSLLQIHLFGLATHHCWFGYDAGGQRVLLFYPLDLESSTSETAMDRIETFVDQVQYWQENLPNIASALKPPQEARMVAERFKRKW